MTNITTYMNDAINRLIGNARKISKLGIREIKFLRKYYKNTKTAAKIRQKYKQEGIHIPPFLIASIASQCNLFCSGCYARANKVCGTNAKKLLPNRWKVIFNEAENLGVSFILLAGGEPFMEPEIINIAAANKNIIFPIFTNGTLINENYIKLLNENRNILPVISIEGNLIQTDQRRGEGVYNTIITVMRKFQTFHILYGASVTVTKSNFDTVTGIDFIKNLYDVGCRIVFYVEYVAVDDKTKNLEPDENDRLNLEVRTKSLKSIFKDIIFIAFPGDEKYFGGCLAAGRGFFHINPSGDAEPCPFSPYSDVNLANNSLKDAIKSELFFKIKDSEITNTPHAGGCVLNIHSDEVRGFLK